MSAHTHTHTHTHLQYKALAYVSQLIDNNALKCRSGYKAAAHGGRRNEI